MSPAEIEDLVDDLWGQVVSLLDDTAPEVTSAEVAEVAEMLALRLQAEAAAHRVPRRRRERVRGAQSLAEARYEAGMG